MNKFEEFIFWNFRSTIQTWAQDAPGQIYAISFYVYDQDDDPRSPSVMLGYNTWEHWQASISLASDVQEAKWNYAFWPQNCASLIGGEDDLGPNALHIEWIENLGLSYTDQEEERDLARAQKLGEKITREFVEMLVSISRRLHTEGVIENTLSQAVPIIIHELEYYHEIANQTERANPPGVAHEFTSWVRGE